MTPRTNKDNMTDDDDEVRFWLLLLLLLSAGHLPVPPGELQAADLQQRVRVPVVGRGDWLVSGSVLHALHPRQRPLQTLQSQGDVQRGEYSPTSHHRVFRLQWITDLFPVKILVQWSRSNMFWISGRFVKSVRCLQKVRTFFWVEKQICQEMFSFFYVKNWARQIFSVKPNKLLFFSGEQNK